MRGLFVTFEGIDRSGKTTQARLLCEALGDAALGVREPGGTPAGERVRDLLKDARVPLGAEAEALLFAAARAELVERVIRPALDAGRVVVSDRYLDSSLAYQGGARGLGVEEVERINRFATGGLVPDLTFLLEIDPPAAAERAGESDRFEDEGAALQQAVLAAYERLVAADPGRWRRDRRRPPAGAGPRRRARRGGGGAQRGARMTRGARRHGGPPAGAHRAVRGARRPGPRTRTCSTARRAPASARSRARSPRSCWPRAQPDPDAVRLRVQHGTHPDLTWVRPTGAHVMRVEDVDQAVVSAATRTPFEASRRVFVLERVDTMNDEVANRLLKTLEEPAHFVHLILLTDALGRVLETVVSRCQPVRFDPLPAARIAAALEADGVEPPCAGACARLALGNAARARLLASPEGDELRAEVDAFAGGRARRRARARPWRPLLERAERRARRGRGDDRGRRAPSGSSSSRRGASAARSSASSRRRPSATAAARAPRCSTWR